MGMGNSFETITVLQYRLKEAQEELAAFQSGEKYIRMEKQHLTQVRALERRIAKLEAAVAKEHSHAITIRNQWFEIFEQLQKECDRMVAEAVKKADMMEKLLLWVSVRKTLQIHRMVPCLLQLRFMSFLVQKYSCTSM